MSVAAYKVVENTNNEFQVRVAGRFDIHPINWSPFDEGYNVVAIQYQAAIQPLPVVFLDEDGTRHEHGVQFSPAAFERAAYGGYVAYGISMTDGHYAPIDFEAWVKSFREFPEENLKFNDFYPAAGALEMYLG